MQVQSNVIKKNYRGEWTAKARLPLAAPRELQIYTMKSASGLLRTYASVVEIEESTPGVRIEKFEIFGDYNKTVMQQKVRCTAKAIETQQAAAIGALAEIVADAKAFYAAKGIEL